MKKGGVLHELAFANQPIMQTEAQRTLLTRLESEARQSVPKAPRLESEARHVPKARTNLNHVPVSISRRALGIVGVKIIHFK